MKHVLSRGISSASWYIMMFTSIAFVLSTIESAALLATFSASGRIPGIHLPFVQKSFIVSLFDMSPYRKRFCGSTLRENCLHGCNQTVSEVITQHRPPQTHTHTHTHTPSHTVHHHLTHTREHPHTHTPTLTPTHHHTQYITTSSTPTHTHTPTHKEK